MADPRKAFAGSGGFARGGTWQGEVGERGGRGPRVSSPTTERSPPGQRTWPPPPRAETRPNNTSSIMAAKNPGQHRSQLRHLELHAFAVRDLPASRRAARPRPSRGRGGDRRIGNRALESHSIRCYRPSPSPSFSLRPPSLASVSPCSSLGSPSWLEPARGGPLGPPAGNGA